MSDQEPRKTPVNLQADGVLWYINRVAFHPRGLALGYNEDDGSFELWGNGDEPWHFAPPVDEDEKFRALNELIKKVTT